MGLKTQLAALAHEIWSSWMIWMFGQGTYNDDGSWTMPKEKVERWHRQMNTKFYALPKNEQESDYYQAEKIIDVVFK